MAYNFSNKPRKGKYKKSNCNNRESKQPKQSKGKGWFLLILIGIILLVAFYFWATHRTITYYVSDQTPVNYLDISDSLTDEERVYYENRLLFELNYYDNADNNGIALQEMQLDYFVDETLTTESARSTNMQYIGKYKQKKYTVLTNQNNYSSKDFYYYDTTVMDGNVINWSGGKVAKNLCRNTSLIIKIDNKPYLLKLTAKETSKFLFWTYDTKLYNYDDIFADCMKLVESSTKGYGSYYVTIDLSNYFTLFGYNENTKEWIREDIAKEVLIFSTLKVNYYERGAQQSSDSLCGLIKNDKDFDIKHSIVKFSTYNATGEMADQQFELGVEQPLADCTYLLDGAKLSFWYIQPDDSTIDYKFMPNEVVKFIYLNGSLYFVSENYKIKLEDNSVTLVASFISAEFGTGTYVVEDILTCYLDIDAITLTNINYRGTTYTAIDNDSSPTTNSYMFILINADNEKCFEFSIRLSIDETYRKINIRKIEKYGSTHVETLNFEYYPS